VRKRLRETEWEAMLSSRRTEENWNTFKKIIEDCVNDHVPYYRAFNNSRPRWMSKEITSLVRRKRAAWGLEIIQTISLSRKCRKVKQSGEGGQE
jgi:hypothetical protein